MVERISRAEEVERALLEKLGELAGADGRLPTEAEIAEMFNVSRGTVRSAVGALAARGLVTRRQGIGTFVNQVALMANPLDQAIGFCEIIARNGFQPGIHFIKAAIVRPEARIGEALRQPDEPVLLRHTIFTANDDPVIYCINAIPLWLIAESLREEVVADPSISEPIYEFLEARCGQRLEFHQAAIWPDIAENCDLCEMTLEPRTPVLVLEEVGYTYENRAILYSLEYYPGRFMKFEMARRRTPLPRPNPSPGYLI